MSSSLTVGPEVRPAWEGMAPREALDEAVRRHAAGQFKGAVPYYIWAVWEDGRRASLENRAMDADILHAAGVALAMGGKRKEAIEFLEQAILVGKRESGACWSALALAYVETREIGKAERAYQKACRYDSRSAANWIGFGNLAHCGGMREIGDRRYDNALACPARDPEELIAQGMVYLQRGHWRKGWRAYEARAKTAMWRERNPNASKLLDSETPQMTYWRQPEKGQTILLLAEQGLGDTIQFARYVEPLMRKFKCHVLLEVPEALYSLLTPALPAGTVILRGDTPPKFDGWGLLLSAPAILREDNRKIVPLPIQPFGEQWMPMTEGQKGRIFVQSRGNPQHGYDFDRSAPAGVIESRLSAAGFTIVTANFRDVPATGEGGEGPAIAVSHPPSWRETVDQLHGCQACVTVDTALAHVAGSLGIPTKLLPTTIPEWRWGPTLSSKTPWYPSMTLHHRSRTEYWDAALAELLPSLGAP